MAARKKNQNAASSAAAQSAGYGEAIALVGMGALFPHAQGLHEYWRLLRRGEDAIEEVPASHWTSDDHGRNAAFPADSPLDFVSSTRGGFLSPTEFDPLEYGIPPSVLEATDTAQLLALVVGKQALEDAGYGEGRDFDRTRASVILGVTGTLELAIPLGARLGHPHWRRALIEAGVDREAAETVIARMLESYVPWQENSFPGLLGNVVAGRIANRLNLRGTNCVVDAACASSLAAVQNAVMELQTGRCDIALTGGVDTFNDVFMFMCFSKTQALSPTGDAKPFAADADGTALGEGIGMVVLKRLADAQRDGDRIRGILRGIGSSSDGKSQSIYAPRAEGQARALRNAYALAQVEPGTIGLLEAHGTGTAVGDVVEFESLSEVYGDAAKSGARTALGSVKSQIGHTKAAAGAAAMIKCVLALGHKVLPPTIKIGAPNPKLDLAKGAFYLNTLARPWFNKLKSPRRAAMSAFGFGGSNFHAVFEEAEPEKTETAWDGSVEMAAFSAPDFGAIRAAVQEWAGWLANAPSQDAFAWRAAQSRKNFRAADPCRLLIVVEHGADRAGLFGKALAQMDKGDPSGVALPDIYFSAGDAPGQLAFVFPGQGSQYVGMGRELACVFPEAFGAIEQATANADTAAPLHDLIYPEPAFDAAARAAQEETLKDTAHAQPALGAVCRATLEVLRRFGLKPDHVAGHSFGEIVALYAADVLGPDVMARLGALRGKLMGTGEGDRGAMLAVMAPLEDIKALLTRENLQAVLANLNHPEQGILSGCREAIRTAQKLCEARGWKVKPLSVAAAFHSPLMEKARHAFAEALESFQFHAPQVPVMANATGESYPDDAGAMRRLLAEQLTSPVQFVKTIENMYAAGVRTFVEVGPKSVLTGLVGAILGDRPHRSIAVDASGGRRPALGDLARSLAQLTAAGYHVALDRWERAVAEPRPRKMPLPIRGVNYRNPASKKSAVTLPDYPAASPRAATPKTPQGAGAAPMSGQHGAPRAAAPAWDVSTFPAPSGAQPSPAQVNGTIMPQNDFNTGAIAPQHAANSPSGPPPQPGQPSFGLPWQAVQQGLAAMQELQRQTAEAHQRFLEVQTQAQITFRQLLGVAAHPGATPAPAPHATPAPAAWVAAPVAQASPIATRFAAAPPATASFSAPSLHAPAADLPASAAHAPVPNAAPVSVAASTPSTLSTPASAAPAFESLLRGIVAELTGYPETMIELGMDLEADLGIDSIKRVEILAALQERAAGFAAVDSGQMSGLRTLGEILAAMEAAAPSAPAAEPANGHSRSHGNGHEYANGNGNGKVHSPAAALPNAARAAASPPADAAGFAAVPAAAMAEALRATLASLTGYPVAMLEDGMDLEADLGIDSIKRVEILAAVQEQFPATAGVDSATLSSLRTLGALAGALAAAVPCVVPVAAASVAAAASPAPAFAAPAAAPTAAAPVPRAALAEVPAASATVPRGALHLSDLAPLASGDALLPASGCVALLADAADPLYAALVAEFAAHRLTTMRLDCAATSFKEPLENLCGLVILAAPDRLHTTLWPRPSENRAKTAFRWARHAAPALRAFGSGAFFAGVTRLDGAFGLARADFDPLAGALAGLTKTAALEWPTVACRALDCDPDWAAADPAGAARALVAEFLSDGPIERAVSADARRGLVLESSADLPASAPLPLAPGDVVLITGGARGVTAACAVALAQACQPTLVLAGRSPLPEPEPAWLAACAEGPALTRAVASAAADAGETLKPAELDSRVQAIAAAREIRATLAALRAAGSRVEYRALDLRDRDAVEETVAALRCELGPIRGLIHGAGVIEDRRIEDKTQAQFERVFDTKVKALGDLLDTLDVDALRCLVCFSSASARCGNAGQADYAMANEALNKIAQRFARRHPACRVVSINWGPWEGGMVTPSLAKHFARRGVSLIPLAAGAAAMLDELRRAPGEAVEVVRGALFERASTAETSTNGNGNGHGNGHANGHGKTNGKANGNNGHAPRLHLAFERVIDVVTHPFLASHILDGRPVLPLAMIIEWFAHAALHNHPGLVFAGLRDLRVLKGAALEDGALSLRAMASRCSRHVDHYDVHVALVGGEVGRETPHARAIVELADATPVAPDCEIPSDLAVEPFPIAAERIYTSTLFHGAHFHGIVEIDGMSAAGMMATLRTAPAPAAWIEAPLRQDWHTDPLLLDGCLQLPICWVHARRGMGCLPMYGGAYRQYVPRFPAGPLRAAVEIRRSEAHRCVADVTVLGPESNVLARLEGFEWIVDAAILRSFGLAADPAGLA